MRYDIQRNVKNLDGEWDFSLERDFSEKDLIAVPGCWDTTFKYSRHRGEAYYRKKYYYCGKRFLPAGLRWCRELRKSAY